MATHNELGKKGEEIACSYLEENGYLILEKNWRFKQTEIDLIALREGVLIFTEVKSRLDTRFGFPEDAVNRRKQKYLQRASGAYLRQSNFEDEIRFDIISINFGRDGSHELYHIKDAFFPGL